jgi:hypothetical protein
MVKIFGNSFERLTWQIKRELQHNRKPILLLFGNGYESQILLAALQKLGKPFTIVHAVYGEKLGVETRRMLNKFKKKSRIILRPRKKNFESKVWTLNSHALCFEDLNYGFSQKDYLLIGGYKISEPTLIKSYENGSFNGLYCPLLRCSDEWIQRLYQDLKDNEPMGNFFHQNLASDSHHNIEVN